MSGVILSVQCVLQLVLCSKAVVARGLEKTCLPERRDKQQLAGLLGVSNYWQPRGVEELLLRVAFTSNCNLFAGC